MKQNTTTTTTSASVIPASAIVIEYRTEDRKRAKYTITGNESIAVPYAEALKIDNTAGVRAIMTKRDFAIYAYYANIAYEAIAEYFRAIDSTEAKDKAYTAIKAALALSGLKLTGNGYIQLFAGIGAYRKNKEGTRREFRFASFDSFRKFFERFVADGMTLAYVKTPAEVRAEREAAKAAREAARQLEREANKRAKDAGAERKTEKKSK